MEVRTVDVSYLLQPNCLGCSPADKEVLDKGVFGRGLMSGKVLHDSQARRAGFYKDIAMVHAGEGGCHFQHLPLFDYLFFAARMRVSHGVIECRERARLALRATGLDGTRPLGSLTMSQFRVVSIATELVANPTLLVALDPTQVCQYAASYVVNISYISYIL
ncbi:hypothetical protein B484DRAFT_40221 [Ochromonadaceae sp. CCMP2298]|nr:hypothetical protein B484DRAFT_40221 [Ochromonadaceae sp. CCMP2298]